ncbi:MAG: hypothetical protein Q9171_003100 [Xanthocarpia ochracea]
MAPTRKAIVISVGTIAIIGVALRTGLGLGLNNNNAHGFSGTRNNPSDNPSQGGGPNGAQGTVGDLTYYAPGLGACGRYSTENENVCAISHITYDAEANGPNPNTNPLCGKQIRATRNGNSVVVTVVDRCKRVPVVLWVLIAQKFPRAWYTVIGVNADFRWVGEGCKANDIDLSPAAFSQLADAAEGRVKVTWSWLS